MLPSWFLLQAAVTRGSRCSLWFTFFATDEVRTISGAPSDSRDFPWAWGTSSITSMHSKTMPLSFPSRSPSSRGTAGYQVDVGHQSPDDPDVGGSPGPRDRWSPLRSLGFLLHVDISNQRRAGAVWWLVQRVVRSKTRRAKRAPFAGPLLLQITKTTRGGPPL